MIPLQYVADDEIMALSYIYILFCMNLTHDYNKSTMAKELNLPYIKNNYHHPFQPIKIVSIVCSLRNIKEIRIVV